MPAFNIDQLKFPSGRSVGNCRKDAKRQAGASSIPLHQALDEVARKNGADKAWHHALNDLQTQISVLPATIGKENGDTMTAADVRSVLEKLTLIHKDMQDTRHGLKTKNDESQTY